MAADGTHKQNAADVDFGGKHKKGVTKRDVEEIRGATIEVGSATFQYF